MKVPQVIVNGFRLVYLRSPCLIAEFQVLLYKLMSRLRRGSL